MAIRSLIDVRKQRLGQHPAYLPRRKRTTTRPLRSPGWPSTKIPPENSGQFNRWTFDRFIKVFCEAFGPAAIKKLPVEEMES